MPGDVPMDVPLIDGAEARFGERFAIRRRIGEGGMGVVYHAYDERRRTDVALKTLHNMGAANVGRLKQEFRALADVAHPNLVTLYELISAGEVWFFTMELVAGVDFLAYVRGGHEAAAIPSERRGGTPTEALSSKETATFHATSSLDEAGPGDARASPGAAPAFVVRPPSANPDRLRRALRQLVLAMKALHDAGKLHLDLKPSNVLVDRDGRVVVLDFGLVRDAAPGRAETRDERRVMGTPAFMAPEQATGGALSPAADLYALGGMLYAALTGELPFPGDAYAAVLRKQHAEPVHPAKLAPSAPRALCDLSAALLRRDPGARATCADVLKILGDGASASSASWAPPERPRSEAPFVGREGELEILRGALEEALSSRRAPAAVFVHGSSGIGKTELVKHFLSGVREGGENSAPAEAPLILSGRCYERESVPFKAWDSVVDALASRLQRMPFEEATSLLPETIHDLARVFPVLGVIDARRAAPPRASAIESPREQKASAFRALKELFSALAARAPLLVFIDDLQWGDEDSARLIVDLLAPPDPPPMLLLGTYRTEDEGGSPCLRELFGALGEVAFRGARIRKLPLVALPDEQSLLLASSLLRGSQDDAMRRALAVAREAEGSPLFVAELARYIQALGPGAGDPRGSIEPSMASLEHVLSARINDLPDGARRLLLVVAAAAGPVEQGIARRAADLGDGDGRAALAILRSKRLARTRGADDEDAVEAYHDRIREAAYAALGAADAARVHLRLAQALEAKGGADPGVLAGHFQKAGELRRAGEYAFVAAERAFAALAFEEAARLYRLTLALLEEDDVERAREVRVRLGKALINAGRGPEAAAALLDAAKGAPEALAFDLRRLAGEQLLASGHMDEGMKVLLELLTSMGLPYPKTATGTILTLLLDRATIALRGYTFRERDPRAVDPLALRRVDAYAALYPLARTDPLRGLSFQGRALLEALDAGEPRRAAVALAWELSAQVLLGRARTRKAQALREDLERLVQRVDDPRSAGLLELARAIHATHEGRLRQGLEAFQEAERLFRDRCADAAWLVATTRIQALPCACMLGELAWLSRVLPGWIKDAEERGDRYSVTDLRTIIGASTVVLLAADEPARARRDITRALSTWPGTKLLAHHLHALHAWTLVDLYEGNADSARRRLSGETPAVERSRLLLVQALRVAFLHNRAAASLAAAEGAEGAEARRSLVEAALRDAKKLASERLGLASAFARLLEAGAAAARGDVGAARVRLRRAIEACDAVDMALHATAARRRLGALLGGDEGRALVTAADASLERQGVKRPDRFAAMLAPGFERRGGAP